MVRCENRRHNSGDLQGVDHRSLRYHRRYTCRPVSLQYIVIPMNILYSFSPSTCIESIEHSNTHKHYTCADSSHNFAISRSFSFFLFSGLRFPHGVRPCQLLCWRRPRWFSTSSDLWLFSTPRFFTLHLVHVADFSLEESFPRHLAC